MHGMRHPEGWLEYARVPLLAAWSAGRFALASSLGVAEYAQDTREDVMQMQALRIRAAEPGDDRWRAALLVDAWASTRIVTRGRVHDAARLPAWVALLDGQRAGLLTYRMAESECEIVSLNSQRERVGIGSALLATVADAARRAGCTRLWLVTTNDNAPAIAFYKRRGFRVAAVHRGALTESRRLKPEIPLQGRGGIPLRDEVELDLPLKTRR
jgi:ribosomal protein S18 acetylase RimI-like enzyme